MLCIWQSTDVNFTSPAGCMTPGSDEESGKGERNPVPQNCLQPFKMTSMFEDSEADFSLSCNLLQVNKQIFM